MSDYWAQQPLTTPRDEPRHQARLAHEAHTVLLDTLTVGDKVVNVAKVEVTYAHGDSWCSDYEEHCGHVIVKMPGDVDPWLTAQEAVEGWLERRYPDATYTSVDDISAI